ncbi:MAG: M20 family peptidase [Verrucomicrobia bacterium]|nr:MAG: M20 family peptidase [Verrucomicrobiota bacterium]
MSTDPARLLLELIALPSVNPSLVGAGHPRAGESAVAAWVADRARRAGLDVGHQTVEGDRTNVLLRLTPSGRIRRRLVLAPHLDTVDGPEEAFRPELRGGRIHGRGACDTKGSAAAMLAALFRLAASDSRPRRTEIVFAGLVDEEFAQKGSRRFVREKLRADLAIVGEPTRCTVVTAHKGDLWLRLTATGKAAHGSTPHLGRNAALTAARAVVLLETRYARELARRRHPLLGHPTVNVGAIHGGSQPNIVPDRCEVLIDRRTLPGETPASVRRELRALFRGAGLTLRLEDHREARCDPMETDPGHPLVRELMELAGQTQPVGVDYFCDAGVLAAGGIRSVVFGPGDIAQAHTAREWISLRSLERAAAILTRFLERQP